MPKKESTFCRSAEEIAAALGITVPKQRNRATRILNEIRQWMRGENLPAGRGAFPAKGKNGYWVRAEITAWERGQFKVKSSKLKKPDKGESSSAKASADRPSTINHQPSTPELPEAAAPAEGELFDHDEGLALEKLLDQWEDKLKDPDKWLEAPIQRWQLEKLEKHRPHLFGGGTATASENITGGVRGVANYIRNNYPGVVVDHMTVQRWKEGSYLPPGCKENFPGQDAGGRYKRAEVDAWVVRYLAAPAKGQDLGLNLHELQQRAEVERLQYEKWDRDQKMRADDRNFLRVDKMISWGQELGRAVFATVDRRENELVRRFGEAPAVQAIPLTLRGPVLAALRVLRIEDNEALKQEMERGMKELAVRVDEPGTSNIERPTSNLTGKF